MSAEKSTPQPAQDNIDALQQQLQAEHGQKPLEAEAMAKWQETSLRGVNDFQILLGRVRAEADVQKHGNQSDWKRLTAVCNAAERELLEYVRGLLKDGKPRKETAALQAKLEKLTRYLAEELPPAPERETVTTARRVLEEKRDALASLQQTAASYDAKIQEMVRGVAEDAQRHKNILLNPFAGSTYTEGENALRKTIERIRRLEKAKADLALQMQPLATEILRRELTLTEMSVADMRGRGEEEKANHTLLLTWEKHGSDLRTLNPRLWEDIVKAAEATEASGANKQDVALSRALLSEHRGEDLPTNRAAYRAALDAAMQESVETQHTWEMLDQARAGIRLEPYVQRELAPPRDAGVRKTTEVENLPDPTQGTLQTIRFGEEETSKGVLFTQEAMARMQQPPQGMKAVLIRKPESIRMQPRTTVVNLLSPMKSVWHIQSFDTVTPADIGYVWMSHDTARIRKPGDKTLTEVSFSAKNDEQDARSSNVLRVLDRHPDMQGAMQGAIKFQGGLQRLQSLFIAGTDGQRFEGFVKYCQAEAQNVQAIMTDPAMLGNLAAAKELLAQLRSETVRGMGGTKLEREVEERMQALENFVRTMESPVLQHMIQTMQDVSQWSATTWANWWKHEGPKILAAIALAVVVVATIVATWGAATPLWILAAGGAAGGLVGAELMAELQYHDEKAKAEKAGLRYSQRSRLGAYFGGEKVFDAYLGEFRTPDLLRDVVSPYVEQFALDFAVTYATLGASKLTGGALGKFLSNGRVQQFLSKQLPTLQKCSRQMNALLQKADLKRLFGSAEQAGNRLPAKNMQEIFARVLKTVPAETFDEMSDTALEEALGKFLDACQTGLTQAESELGAGDGASFLLGTIKNMRIKGPKRLAYKPDAGSSRSKSLLELRGTLESKGWLTVQVPGNTNVLHVTNATGDVSYEIEAEGTEMLEVAKQARTNAALLSEVKRYFAENDVGDAERCAIAAALLGQETLTSAQTTAILKAHSQPGVIDHLTPEQIALRVEDLRTAFPETETRRLLLESGVCGKGVASPVVEALDATDTQGREIFTIRTPEGKVYTLPEGMHLKLDAPGESALGAVIPAGAYQVQFLKTAQGIRPTFKPLNPTDAGGSYSVNFAKTTFRGISPSDVRDGQATSWKKPKAAPAAGSKTSVLQKVPQANTAPEKPCTLENVTKALEQGTLLDLFEHASYAEIREQLRGYNYVDLLKHKATYDRNVAMLEAKYQQTHPGAKPRTFPGSMAEPAALQQYLFDAVTKKHLQGETRSKNQNETEHGGYVLHYGQGVTESACNSVYINPRVEQVGVVLSALDKALTGQNAQIKVYVEGFDDAFDPQKRGANKLVIYFDGNDAAGMTKFFQALQKLGPEFRCLLKPESFTYALSKLRIPVSPGISYVERNTAGSWDSAAPNSFDWSGNAFAFNQLAMNFDEAKFTKILRTGADKTLRERHMPGLRATPNTNARAPKPVARPATAPKSAAAPNVTAAPSPKAETEGANMLDLAKKARTNSALLPELKRYFAENDVGDVERFAIAAALLGQETLTSAQTTAILKAHGRPGIIDQLTPKQIALRVEDLRTAFPETETRRLLLESGVCGKGASSPHVEKLDATDTQGREIFTIRTAEGKVYNLPDGMYLRLDAPGESALGAVIPAGAYQVQFLQTAQGIQPTLKPLNPENAGGSYGINFAKTTFRSISQSDIRDGQATNWKQPPAPPAPRSKTNVSPQATAKTNAQAPKPIATPAITPKPVTAPKAAAPSPAKTNTAPIARQAQPKAVPAAPQTKPKVIPATPQVQPKATPAPALAKSPPVAPLSKTTSTPVVQQAQPKRTPSTPSATLQPKSQAIPPELVPMQKTEAKARAIANDPPSTPPFDVEMLRLLKTVRDTGGVYIHTNSKDESGRYEGYTTYGNPNAPPEASRSNTPSIMKESYTTGRITSGLYEGIGNAAENMETVRLTEPMNGKRGLLYAFHAPQQMEFRSNRPGGKMDVGIILSDAEAQALFTMLQRNPAQARAFFIAASQDVKRAEYLWTDCRPQYDKTDTQRKMLFMHDRSPTEQGPARSYALHEVRNGKWESIEPAAKLAKDLKESVQERESQRARRLAPAEPEPKKTPGLWKRFFG